MLEGDEMTIRHRACAAAAAVILMAATPFARALNSPVADAAMRADGATVRSLIESHTDVNVAQGDGMTALHWAAERGNRELAALLLAAGANVRATTRLGAYTALHLAAKRGHADLLHAVRA